MQATVFCFKNDIGAAHLKQAKPLNNDVTVQECDATGAEASLNCLAPKKTLDKKRFW